MFNLGSVELANLSSNGTKLDGKTIDRVTIADAANRTHEIAFGADEVLRLEARGAPAASASAAEPSSPSADTKPVEPPPEGPAGT
jgi:hypothetical protein